MSDRQLVTSSSQARLINETKAHYEDIRHASNVALLSDTLKSFCDNEDNLKSIAEFYNKGGNLRILLIDPKSSGIALTVKARQANNRIETTSGYSSEVITSIRRIRNYITTEKLIRIIRLYDYPAFNASYIFDDVAFVTQFTFGRGGSSPSLYVKDLPGDKDYFNGIKRGFDELWRAQNTRQLTINELEELIKT